MDDYALLAAWCRSMKARNFSKGTISSYRHTLQQFLIWCQSQNLQFLTVTYRDIQDWLEACKIGPRSRYSYTSRLASMYTWLIREEMIDHNPTTRVDRPKLGRRLPRPAETDTVRQAMETADPRVAAMIALGTFAGMRRFEIARLRVEDLWLRRRPPSILIHGKGERDRIVTINESVIVALRRHGLPASGYLFEGRQDGHLSPARVGDLVAAALSACEDGRVTTHRLRHWFGSEVYASSHDLRLTQEVMGHASPATTAIYAAYNNSDAQRVVGGLSLEASAEAEAS